MSRLDPTSLRVFVSVVEEGTIAAAGAREHLVPAAVSKRISEIEGQLNTRLLTRTNKGVEPTAAGIALAGLARRALSELEQIPILLEGYATGVCGLVRVCASMSAMGQFLPGDLKSFLELYPKVQIQVEECASSTVTKVVAENGADVGVFTSAPHREELDTLLYREDRLVLAVAKDHQLASASSVPLASVLHEPFIGLPPNNAIGMLLEREASLHNRSLTPRIQVSSFDALCVMVGCGFGLGVMPEEIARRNAAALGLRAVHLEDAWALRDFHICVRAGGPLSAVARMLSGHLHAQAMVTRRH